MNSEQLQAYLDGFTGSETWHRHPLNRKLLWTDGVDAFAQEAQAYWFIDLVAVGAYGNQGIVPSVIPDQDGFGVVILSSLDGKGAVEVYRDSEDDGSYSPALRIFNQPLRFADAPEGAWKFYVVWDGEHVVLMLPSEY